MNITSLPVNYMHRSLGWSAFFLIPLLLACIALAPQTRATCQHGCLTNQNTVLGEDALLNNTGDSNTAIGFGALVSNTTGFQNTAIGNEALEFNTTGLWNTAIGHNALVENTTGIANTAVGWGALSANVTGGSNTAVGISALAANTGGSNTAIGADAMDLNTTGNFNTATGTGALQSNTTGSNNAAYGLFSLQTNTTGSNNTAIGFETLRLNRQGVNNTALGNNSLYNCRGSSNTAIGISAGMNITRGNNDICIGNVGVATESNTIRIGNETHTNAFIAGVSGVTVAGGIGVIIDSSGHLGTMVSSARFKDAVKPMDKTSETILALKPVTFRYKKELDPDGIPQFGLVAEEVEKVNPDLVARDEQSKPYTVRYEAVNAMLLNEFLKEHRKVEALEKQVAKLTAGLQKVSAQLELSESAPQTVLNDQ